jgi:hypothetical protein
MKRAILAGLAVGAMVAACGTASAATLSILAKGNGTTSGGEFKVDVTGDNVVDFVTFCIELDEYITVPGGPYNYTASQSALLGGNNTDAGDPLSRASAWIYDQYVAGTLGSSLTGTAATTYAGLSASGKADAVQNALWYLEEEIVTANFLSNWAESNVAIRSVPNGGVIGVNVLNLTSSSGNHQSLLRVPDGGMALGMLGVGLLAVGALRRRVS